MASPGIFQLGQDHRQIARLDRPDMLVADHTLAIDDEAFGNARGAERNLEATLRVATDPRIGVAIAGEEVDEILGPVAYRDSVNEDTPRLQLLKHPHLCDARHAPAGKDIHQVRLAGSEISRAQAGLRRKRGR